MTDIYTTLMIRKHTAASGSSGCGLRWDETIMRIEMNGITVACKWEAAMCTKKKVAIKLYYFKHERK